jgi:hypothetical protein
MKCGWGSSAQLTGRNMRAYFTICPSRPAAFDREDRRGRTRRSSTDSHRAADAMRLALRRQTHGIRAHFNNCTRRPWVRGPGGQIFPSRKSSRRGPFSE